MTAYDDAEKSIEDSEPIELYEFEYEGQYIRYTSGDVPITYNSNVYTPAGIRRGSVSNQTESTAPPLKINMDVLSEVAVLLRDEPPSAVLNLTVRRHQRNVPGFYPVIAFGSILGGTWSDTEVSFDSFTSVRSEQRIAMTPRYQKRCRHDLYGVGCGVDPDAYVVSAVAEVITDNVIQSSGLTGVDDDWFAGGFMTYPDSATGILAKRDIIASDGIAGTITLTRPPARLAVNATLQAYPGCNHTTHCKTKYNNLLNSGRCPLIPLKNPNGVQTPLY